MGMITSDKIRQSSVVTQCNSCAHAKVCRYVDAMTSYRDKILMLHDDQDMKNFTANITCSKYHSITG